MRIVKLFIACIIYFIIIVSLANEVFANTPGSHSVSLTWVDNDGTVVKYNVYKGTATGVCSGTPTPYASSTTKSYVDTSVTAGTQYIYAVSAVNGAGGESTCSSEVQVTVPTSPQTPTNLQGVAQ